MKRQEEESHPHLNIGEVGTLTVADELLEINLTNDPGQSSGRTERSVRPDVQHIDRAERVIVATKVTRWNLSIGELGNPVTISEIVDRDTLINLRREVDFLIANVTWPDDLEEDSGGDQSEADTSTAGEKTSGTAGKTQQKTHAQLERISDTFESESARETNIPAEKNPKPAF